ncbi:hypothetical protein CAEBREN_13572 [Caenorhabditis brenneri]|uniref:Uncharacterized protein n=1 Tax=Caenorhabditis brenneri TaxID=135651 RepID=G0MTH8_CAEBE|nr:hypothetical protein CAEBREN_13572 [Caenorhabditis brenneri]
MSTNAEQLQEPVLVVGDNFFVIGANESFSDSPLPSISIDVVTEEIVCDNHCNPDVDEYSLMYEGCERPLTNEERREHRKRENSVRNAQLSNENDTDSSNTSPVNETLLLPHSIRQPSAPKRLRKITDEDLLMSTGQEENLEPAEVLTSSVADTGEKGVPTSKRLPSLFSMENLLKNLEAPLAPTTAPVSSPPQQCVAQSAATSTTSSESVEDSSTGTPPQPIENESTLPLPSTILKEYYERLSYALPFFLSSEVPSTSPSTSSSSESSGPVEAIDLTVGNRSISDEIPQSSNKMTAVPDTLRPPFAVPSTLPPWMVPGINPFASRLLPPFGTLTPIAPPAFPVAHSPLPTNFFRDMLKKMEINSRQNEVKDEPPRKRQKVDDVSIAGEIPKNQMPELNSSVQEVFNMNLQSIRRQNISNATLEDVMKCISLGVTEGVNHQLNLILNTGDAMKRMSNSHGEGSAKIQEEGEDLDIEDNNLNMIDSPRSGSVSVHTDNEELMKNYGLIENFTEAPSASDLEAANALLGLSATTKGLKKKLHNAKAD